MTTADLIFPEMGGQQADNTPRTIPGLSFPSEKDLDDKLWFDPENAADDILYLLNLHKNEISPTMSRLALKAIAMPVLIREFQGAASTPETDHDVRFVAHRNSQLMNAYMDLVGDSSVNQKILKQSIEDATVMQLINRSLRSKESDDTILLPIGPDADSMAPNTSFTVLRRKSLGRALLYVSNVRPVAYSNNPQANLHRIQIQPDSLTPAGGEFNDLTEALITEQGTTSITGAEHDLIMTAAAHVHNKIATHFENIQPRS